ncbi:PREDICTED: protein SET DOMAIN GROUP 40-like [Camelina sativa]|uniref:Protein SET DOMAIN GROUP 40-like n=1 Tax=Camelina sativa TaxID=90675 RepID=A0ABM0T3P8_CAMSA|nr:PREDICTED: protein SET DOMAIN GROUP 40-like [Camelina sativa]
MGTMELEHQTMETFLRWAADIGISDSIDSSRFRDSCLGHSLSVADFPLAGGRGLGAARELKKGELVLKVPRNALMTTESMVAKDQKLNDAVHLHGSLSSTQILSVCLLYEMSKGKKSFWYPYLVHLPRDYDLLATFGELEKQALQVEDAVWITEKATAKCQSEWKEAVTLMKELYLKPKFQSFQAWLWASATISSRTLHIPWDSAGCLCPVGDLFNYDAPGDDSNNSEGPESAVQTSSPQPISTTNECRNNEEAGLVVETQSERLTDGGFEEDANAYCLYARRNYQLGEQVLLCYGTYTNLELLEHYGFMLEENSNDRVFIPLETSLYSLASSWPKDSLYIHQDGKPSFALVSTLRLWLIPQSQRDKSVMRLVYAGSQISAKNEILVMKWMSEICGSVLRDLPTSVSEDTLLLHNIDKLQDPELPLEEKEKEAFGSEMRAFLDVNRLWDVIGFSGKDVEFSRRTNRMMIKWRLSVQWRLSYKRTLADCISYCNEKMNNLLSTQR